MQYLDVGLTLEVEPQVYSDNDVAIGINLIVSSIANTVKVGDTIAYELRNRNATTKLQLKDGETQILAGLINDTESRSATSVPGLGDIPLIGRLFSNNNTSTRQVGIGDVHYAARHSCQGATAGRDHGILVRHGIAQWPGAAAHLERSARAGGRGRRRWQGQRCSGERRNHQSGSGECSIHTRAGRCQHGGLEYGYWRSGGSKRGERSFGGALSANCSAAGHRRGALR